MACWAPRPVKVSHWHVPAAVLRVRADVDFTALERTLIEQATRDLEYQTAGYLSVKLEFDLNYSDGSAADEGAMLVRTYSWAPLTLDVEGRRHAYVFGFTYSDAQKSYLVSDRLASPEAWRHVTMHELLHAVGLRDLPDSEVDVMSGARTGKTPTTCMSWRDAREFCRVHRCTWQQLNYCGS